MPKSKLHIKIDELQDKLLIINNCLYDIKEKYILCGIVETKIKILNIQKKDILKEMNKLERKFLDD